ncbi:MAG: hypothetical protein ILP10_01775, partial [Lachnospiraceae bacterium]|nr:hypothetical protein [Lachnospiraceae bacterium]
GQEDGGEHPSSALSSCNMLEVKRAMQFFGSSSPSYLLMESLDLANAYLDRGYREILAEFCKSVDRLKSQIEDMGWRQISMEPLKITIKIGDMCGTELSDASSKSPNPSSLVKMSGTELAGELRAHGIECEYADSEHVVLMFTPSNGTEVYEKVRTALQDIACSYRRDLTAQNIKKSLRTDCSRPHETCPLPHPEKRMSIREACMAPYERVSATEAVGRVCARFAVKCPPAVPRIMPGEVIAEGMIGDGDIEVVR